MNTKTIITQYLLPPFLTNITRKILVRDNQAILSKYIKSGQIPWSEGYGLYKQKIIIETVNSTNMLNLFKDNSNLPENYGYGIDERCVELPWLFANLTINAKCILDAGSVLNHEFIIKHPTFENRKLHIFSLAPEKRCYWKEGVSYFYDDLRNIPIKDNFYDAIICLSTLEHIGCDNTGYIECNNYQESNLEDFSLAMKELYRILKLGGSLFLSVPYGKYQNFGTFQQFDHNLLEQAITVFGETKEVNKTFYKYNSQGWQISKAEECDNCEFVEWYAKALQTHNKPNPIPVEPDHGAAARAVACVKMVKID